LFDVCSNFLPGRGQAFRAHGDIRKYLRFFASRARARAAFPSVWSFFPCGPGLAVRFLFLTAPAVVFCDITASASTKGWSV
jgi:hypothetical protein